VPPYLLVTTSTGEEPDAGITNTVLHWEGGHIDTKTSNCFNQTQAKVALASNAGNAVQSSRVANTGVGIPSS
jgi:hypothetical protein